MATRLNGPLTLAWIEQKVPEYLFRPTVDRAAGVDPYRLGWERVRPTRTLVLDLEIAELPWAAAEGVVGLATITEALRAVDLSVRLEELTPRSEWSRGLHLEQLTSGEWSHPEAMSGISTARCRVDPIRRWAVTDPAACVRVADALQQRIIGMLDQLSYTDSGVATAVRLLAHQALLNVLEHAYDSGTEPVAFSCITLSPTEEWAGPNVPLSTAERAWLELRGGRILEVAIGDWGAGIPATLWEAYGRKHAHAFDELKRLSLGSKSGRIERARLHQKITTWALAHDSTRKRKGDFGGDVRYLNWRGLHRAANIIADVDGCLVIRSGQARAGYAFRESQARTLETEPPALLKEFPGTTVVVRVPVPAPQARHTRTTVAETAVRPDLRPQRIVRASVWAEELKGSPGDTPQVCVICHPFSRVDADDAGELLHLIRSIPPNYVQIHAFAQVADEAILTQFHAFKDDPEYDLPTLICFWSPGERPTWKFVGQMPTGARPLISSLEKYGRTPIPPELFGFAKELYRTYAPYVVIEGNALRLEVVKQKIAEDSADRALQLAFEEFEGGSDPRTWRTEEQGTLIRLRSGRLVRKYVSVLELLNANDLLARSVGQKLAAKLYRLQQARPGLRLIADSEASYFLARHLLTEQGLRMDVRADEDTDVVQGPTVAFVDAVYKGETLKRLMARQSDCAGVICCVDLRQNSPAETKSLACDSLLRLSFDPEEATEEETRFAKSVLEIDQVTHVPCKSADPEAYALGTSPGRTEFILQHADLLRYGVHLSGGRVHVVSHSTAEMVKRHSEDLARWIAEEVSRSLRTIRAGEKPQDIVLFSRADSNMHHMVPVIADLLEQTIGATVFASTIPAAPYKSREVFGRVDPEQDLLTNVQRLGRTRLLALVPPTRFVAVLLDDAAVTGRGLLNSVIRLVGARDELRPASIVAIPVFTRLSPAEEQLYGSLLKTVGPPTDVLPTRFEFAPLFRLQVRSYDDPAATPAVKHLTWMERSQQFFGPRLRGYLEKVRRRLEETVRQPGREGAPAKICAHPFYSGSRASERTTASAQTVQIRHHIALYEQNVAVLGQLLHEVRESCNAGDASLLTLFATEPSLLELRPFRRHCHRDLIDLALRTLRDPVVGAPLRSDALVMLFAGQVPAADLVGEIAAAVQDDEDLLEQFLVMLLANSSGGPLAGGEIASAIYKRVRRDEAASLIRASLRAWDDLCAPPSITSVDDALREVVRAVTHLIYHASGDREFNAPTTWIQTDPAEVRAQQPGTHVAPLLRRAVVAAREFLLPALASMEYLARQQQHGQAIGELDEAHAALVHLLSELAEHADSLGEEPLGSEEVQRIEDLWTRIKEKTQFGAPQTYLARPPVAGDTSGVLATWMPEFFCLPVGVATDVALQSRQAGVSADWQQQATGIEAVLVRAPLSDVRELFALLLGDAWRHGTGPVRVDFTRVIADEGTQLVALVNNVVASRPRRGAGRSRERVRDIAKRHTWKVDFGESAIAGKPYEVRIVFPVVYDVHKE